MKPSHPVWVGCVGMFNINHIYVVIRNTDVFNKPGSIKCVIPGDS